MATCGVSSRPRSRTSRAHPVSDEPRPPAADAAAVRRSFAAERLSARRHVLFGLPPSVHGELALKWFELIHTGLPLAAFSALSAPFTLAPEKRRKLHETHVPWALEAGAAATPLLAVYYEKHWHRDLDALRNELGVIVAPPLKS